jgi:hypothetical protein
MADHHRVAAPELRRLRATEVQVVHTRYQEAVAQQIANGFRAGGRGEPHDRASGRRTAAACWSETQPVVNWSVLASPKCPRRIGRALRTAILAMKTPRPDVMGGLGVKQWAAAERQEYLALLDYTKE